MPTPLGICPHSLSVQPATQPAVMLDPSALAPKDTTHGVTCIGVQCHYWRFEPGADPRDGDCADVLTALYLSTIANLAQRAFNAGAAEAQAAQHAAAPDA